MSKALQLTKRDICVSLDRLIDLRIIRKDVSINSLIFGKNYETKYVFDNSFIGYYVKYNYMNRQLLNLNKDNEVIAYLKEHFPTNNLISETYCKLCYQTLEKLGLKYDFVAKYFDDEIIIDLVAVNKKEKYIILGDCSYKTSKKGLAELEELASFYQEIVLEKFKGYKVKHYLIFNEFGFDDELVEVSKQNRNLHLVSNKK